MPSVHTLAYEVRGDGSGPPVVCLPMFATTRRVTVEALGPALAGAGRRQVYADLPGHGETPASAEATSEAVLAAVAAFVTEHDTGDGVLLAGCSYGAYLAAAIARRWPARVRGLLLVCPGVRIGPAERDLPGPPVRGGKPGWLDDVAPEFTEHLDLALGRRERAVAARVSALLADGTAGDSAYQQRLKGDHYALDDQDARTAFAGPTAVVTGRQDRVAGFADQYRQMPLYPRGTFAVLDEAGHYLPFEQPDLLRALAQQWLQRCM